MERRRTIEEKKFTNQNWKVVLNEIYDYAPNGYGRGNPQYQDDHPLARRLKIKGYELSLIMAFLDDNGLIEYVKPDNNWIQLTSKGFDVAVQNERDQKASVFNKVTVFLSLAITVFAVAQLLTGIVDLLQKWIMSILIVLALICGGLVTVRSRL